MLPAINGKSFLECSIEDLKGILDDQDYRESECLDYKKSFTILEIPKSKKDAVNEAKAEFRKDVCAFANAQGGYLIYGIKEDGKAVPHELVGITIEDNNTDAFENTVKNTLQTVFPRVPRFETAYIPFGDKYIVILYIHHDLFSPYVFLENNNDYRVFKRVGSSTKVASYAEMKTMFSQSITLEKEIERYRKERIDLFYDKEAAYHEKRFVLLHMIPETFLDSSYNSPIYYMCKKGVEFADIFSPFGSMSRPIPTVAGIRYNGMRSGVEGKLQNNGIAELYFPLKGFLEISGKYPDGFFSAMALWENLESLTRAYASKSRYLANSVRVFAGLSIVGCKNVRTDNEWVTTGSIDRHLLICEPVVFENMADEEQLERDIKRFNLETLLSLGIQSPKKINQLLYEVYEQ